MIRKPSPFLRLWGAPIAIALASLIGLISALLGDGPNDWISWLGLGAPLLVLLWARLRRRA